MEATLAFAVLTAPRPFALLAGAGAMEGSAYCSPQAALPCSTWGSITGGNGGSAGLGQRTIGLAPTPDLNAGPDGTAGEGGVGISGAGMTILNGGTIAGGSGRSGQADAIDFTGGANRLALLNATSGLTGGIGLTGTLELAQSTNAVLGGAISGSGSVIKTGAGMLTLTSTNTYTGATIVDGGALAVDGSIATSSLTTVNAGGHAFRLRHCWQHVDNRRHAGAR